MAKRRTSKKTKNVVRTQAEVAKHFKISHHTIRDWRTRANPMPGKQGAYDLDEIEVWRKREFPKEIEKRKLLEEGKPTPTVTLSQRKLQAQVEKEEARAKIESYRATVETGDVVEVVEVRQFLAEFFSVIRKDLLALPIDIASGYPPSMQSQIEEDIRTRLELLLTQRADWIEQTQRLQAKGT